MKFLKYLMIVMMLLAITATGVKAQVGEPVLEEPEFRYTYRTAVGIRAGGTSGITFKQFLGNRGALEAIGGFWSDGFSVTLLIENYANAFNLQGMNWYYGVGGHAAFETSEDFIVEGERFDDESEVALGVDGILGLEYKIPPIPFAVSIDVKPFVEVTTDGNTYMFLDPAVGIKLAF